MERPKAPEPQETNDDVDAALVNDLARLLSERHPLDELVVGAKTGPHAAYLKCTFGPRTRNISVELFLRDASDPGIDGGLGVLVDFLDDVITQHFTSDAWLPLDWTTHPVGRHQVFGRMQQRNIDAEEQADRLLGED